MSDFAPCESAQPQVAGGFAPPAPPLSPPSVVDSTVAVDQRLMECDGRLTIQCTRPRCKGKRKAPALFAPSEKLYGAKCAKFLEAISKLEEIEADTMSVRDTGAYLKAAPLSKSGAVCQTRGLNYRGEQILESTPTR